ncbi:MAG: DUF192 domain-containing protein [Parcubacteria group bacterium]|nr:DUF192 domain-containing protein [Parcubacteria group bacterium]
MTRNKCIIYVFSILAISTALIMFQKKLRQKEVCFRDHCFSVEIAKTRISQAKGLMFRRELAENKGMLFIFNKEGLRSFWMKNTLIPLDIIFFNENKEIVSIAKDVKPCEGEECPSIRPEKEAKYVLELNANIADKIDLKIGDKFNFSLDE